MPCVRCYLSECGPGFTAKLETMFRDVETSTDLNSAYQSMSKQSGGDVDVTPLDLTVSVLTAGSWPTSHLPECPVVMPSELHAHLTRFEKFYHSKHSGRQLKWSHLLGQWVMSATFPGSGKSRKKELSVSTYQGLVMLLFNEVSSGDTLELDTIVQRTGLCTLFPLSNFLYRMLIFSSSCLHHILMYESLAPREAVRTLQSLACGKVRVLTKTPKGKDVNEGDRFGLNADFKHDNFKIKINQIQSKETVSYDQFGSSIHSTHSGFIIWALPQRN